MERPTSRSGGERKFTAHVQDGSFVDEADILRASLPLNPRANLVAQDRGEWRDVTASFSEIWVPIGEFLRRPTLR